MVFVVTDASNLYRRLLKRGTEDAQRIISRLSMAKEECTRMESYDSVLLNDDLDTSTQKMMQFMDGRRIKDEFDIEEFKEEIDRIIRKLESSEVLCSRKSSD